MGLGSFWVWAGNGRAGGEWDPVKLPWWHKSKLTSRGKASWVTPKQDCKTNSSKGRTCKTNPTEGKDCTAPKRRLCEPVPSRGARGTYWKWTGTWGVEGADPTPWPHICASVGYLASPGLRFPGCSWGDRSTG